MIAEANAYLLRRCIGKIGSAALGRSSAALDSDLITAGSHQYDGLAVVAGKVPAVASGLDDVADTSPRPLQAEQHGAVIVDAAEAYEIGAQLGGKSSHLVVGVHDEQRVLARESVGQPGSCPTPLTLVCELETPAQLVLQLATQRIGEAAEGTAPANRVVEPVREALVGDAADELDHVAVAVARIAVH